MSKYIFKMGLFKHKEKREDIPSLPELPRLPELPELPNFEDEHGKQPVHQLPSFPRNSLGDKFSQDTIKEAVTGEKEGKREGADDFESLDERKMMQMPLDENEEYGKSMFKGPARREIEKDENVDFSDFGQKPMPMQNIKTQKKNVGERGPIFVRLDKFEESQKIFDETKRELSGISKILNETKEIKKKEEETLQQWTKELEDIKNQIDKVDQNLFSKI